MLDDIRLAKVPLESDVDHDDSTWRQIEIGKAWEGQIGREFDGDAWYRTKVRIPETFDRTFLFFGGVDSSAWVYVNGQFAGVNHGWDTPFQLDITNYVKKGDQNGIAVKVFDGGIAGGIWRKVMVYSPVSGKRLPEKELQGLEEANQAVRLAKVPIKWRFRLGEPVCRNAWPPAITVARLGRRWVSVWRNSR